MRKVTVIIPCKNERLNIRPCIESARLLADEIIVADSGSTDETLAIVRQMGGCKIIQREFLHYGDFNNWAIPQAKHEWVFILDADERITAELAQEVREALNGESVCDLYWVWRDNYFLGHLIHHSGWGSGKIIRLFRRDQGRYLGVTDHAGVYLCGGVAGRLESRLKHYTFWTYDQYLRKLDRYSRGQAAAWHRHGRKPSLLRLVLTGPFRFLRSYILQFGFLDGAAGFQVCMLHGIYSFLKQARLWELQHGLQQSDLEEVPVRRPVPGARPATKAAA